MSEVDSRYVKRGFWVNIESGPIMGNTITMDIQTGTVIIALLTLLSSLAMTHTWNLITFLYHQLRANGCPADGLFWQQQILLRAGLSPASMLADWLKLFWLWRGSKHVVRRSIPQIPIAILFILGSIAVSITSSYVVSSTNLQVLVSNPLCSPLDTGPGLSNWRDSIALIGNYKREVLSRSQPFAEECYQNLTSLPARCMAFIRPNIPLIPELTRCPFNSKICANHSYSGGVYIDSGLVDTNGIFGWNMQASDKVWYRKKTTCSILRTEGYEEIINASDYPVHTDRDFLPGEQLIVGRFGTRAAGMNWDNITFVHSLLKANISQTYWRGTAVAFLSPNWYEDFTLLPEMKSDNADVAVVQIRKDSIRYTHPVNDPVFSAHKPINFTNVSNGDKAPAYISDWPHSMIACLQQYQFCFARTNAPDFCTNLTGLPGDLRIENFPGITSIQHAVVQLITIASFLFDTSDASAILQASRLLQDGYLDSLPDDQWIREIVGWEKFIWACLQTMVSDYAVGYSSRYPISKALLKKDLTPGERKLCGSQRMRKSGGFININVFGMALIIALSCIVAVIDLVLLRFLIYIRGFRRTLAPRIDRWIQDGVFQLQRRAYQAHGEGYWSRLEAEIPSVSTDLLHELPLELQPRLCKCSSS